MWENSIGEFFVRFHIVDEGESDEGLDPLHIDVKLQVVRSDEMSRDGICCDRFLRSLLNFGDVLI